MPDDGSINGRRRPGLAPGQVIGAGLVTVGAATALLSNSKLGRAAGWLISAAGAAGVFTPQIDDAVTEQRDERASRATMGEWANIAERAARHSSRMVAFPTAMIHDAVDSAARTHETSLVEIQVLQQQLVDVFGHPDSETWFGDLVERRTNDVESFGDGEVDLLDHVVARHHTYMSAQAAFSRFGSELAKSPYALPADREPDHITSASTMYDPDTGDAFPNTRFVLWHEHNAHIVATEQRDDEGAWHRVDARALAFRGRAGTDLRSLLNWMAPQWREVARGTADLDTFTLS